MPKPSMFVTYPNVPVNHRIMHEGSWRVKKYWEYKTLLKKIAVPAS